ncbi:hypothetical protein BU23DRAFT_656000 [Bimuria novae-zelandiae CBS 107.79]|uniref:Uncharacterized protein n=1 Tax=Bimuria novae-zelandiae CBS 107.79 TaxID=1447943 RepID=A0A6A5UVK6_9PLEO|nr:hypothetical protein BU23DRAFT_656000 [Bimuria novae-zelandiae CBS 107.79]
MTPKGKPRSKEEKRSEWYVKMDCAAFDETNQQEDIPTRCTVLAQDSKNSKTPKSRATSGASTVTQTSTTGKKVPGVKVMLLAYRVGNRVHMGSRAYDLHMHENVLIYPTHEEAAWDYPKIYDLHAFDALAKKAEQWRPRWHMCEIERKVPVGSLKKKQTPKEIACPLPAEVYNKKKQVLKRGHSAYSDLVTVLDWQFIELQESLAQHYKNSSPDKNAKRMENRFLHSSRFYHHIHQEYVESLEEFGEIGIFVAIRPKQDGTREPYVVDMIKTRFTQGDAKTIDTERNKIRRKIAGELPKAGPENYPDNGIERCSYANENMIVTRLKRPDVTNAGFA